ncbi:MAG: agmatinase, partial [Thaumarchaeota archaeon]|nr:agmatinase [Nitrososphaerota archaeon]
KICWANTNNFDDSDFVIVGVPDESQSHALRQGTEDAPNRIREISQKRDSYSRDGKTSLGLPYSYSTHTNVYDYGNIDRVQIDEVYDQILSKSKIPITIGGDHSITRHILKALSNNIGKFSLVYFDAHPDFVSSTTNYYGSVFYDVLSHIDVDSSIQIGIRTPEKEELDNIRKFNLKVITPFDIAEKGVAEISESILNTIGKKVYVSFDMDCIDPSYAPGVSVPVPMGLNNVDAIYLLKKIAKQGIVGMDIMEVCPSYDVKDRTSHLASRMISEVIFATDLK